MTARNGHDKSTDIAIGISHGKVVLHWNEPTNYIAFDPLNAFEFGEQVARTAHKAKFGEEAPSDGSYLAKQVRARVTEELRTKMILRATLVYRNLENRDPAYMAATLVDIVLSEVG